MPSPASIRLVVNADGFGASPSRDRGVITAHREGIVTSTSILGNAAEPADVAAALLSTPSLGTGVLLALTGGSPVSEAALVPSLLEGQATFPARIRDLLLVWAKAALRMEDVERELDAQVARWRDLGLHIDHVATKDDVGALPMVATAAEKVARRHGIPGLRATVERPTLAWATDVGRGLATAALAAAQWWSRRQLGALRHGPQTWGHFEAGRLDEIRLLEILGRLGPGSHEIRCAPDLDASPPGSGEVAALCSPRVRAVLAGRPIELCRWADLF